MSDKMSNDRQTNKIMQSLIELAKQNGSGPDGIISDAMKATVETDLQLQTLRARLEAAESRLVTATRLLKRMEFSLTGRDGIIAICPICEAFGEIPTHKPDCPLAAFLSEGSKG